MEEQKTFKEFRKSILPSRKGRKGKVTDSIGVYDIYKMMRKHGWYDIGRPVKEKEFYAIIRGVNKLLAAEVAKGEPVQFPQRMGKLELRKSKRGVSIVGDKLKVTYPVDWDKTYKLWYEDADAMKNKTLLRYEQKYYYQVMYDTFRANYENKVFYQFALNSFIQQELSKNVKNGMIESLWKVRDKWVH